MGLFSSKKKSNENTAIKLLCSPGNVGSYKCVFLASYRKLPVEVSWQESSVTDDELSASLHLEGLNRFPCISEGDFTVCGTDAVLTYLNVKGRTPTIHPRKARVLAQQQYWIQVAEGSLEPLLEDVEKNSEEINQIFKYFDQEIKDKKHVVGEFSLADIHWAGIFKLLEHQDNNSLIAGFENINSWLEKIKKEITDFDSSIEKAA